MAEPFLVVGAMKSGTTTLYELLKRHADVDIVAEKESNSLANVTVHGSFVDAVLRSSRRVAGEVTAGYMQAPLMEQPVQAAGDLGSDLRVVAILREPYARALSHWEHWSQLGREPREVESALLDPSSAYVAFSSYFRQLEPWLELVGRENCLVLRLEDYHSDPVGASTRLWDFLTVPPLSPEESQVHANRGDLRVVATGWPRRVSQSIVYRQGLRPILGATTRRRLATIAGGRRGRVGASPRPSIQRHFIELIADDLAALRGEWPGVEW